MNATHDLKVLYVVTSSASGGATTALLNILKGLVDNRVKPFVVMATKGILCEELDKLNISYWVIRHFESIYPSLYTFKDSVLYFPRFIRMTFYNYKAVRKLFTLTKYLKPDIIHTNIGVDQVGFEVAKKLSIPHVWHIREYQDLDFGWHTFPSKANFIRKLSVDDNYPIAITNSLFDYFKMQNNARIIFDGVIKNVPLKFISEKKKYFLFVGRLEDGKGIQILIEAFIEFAKFNFHYELLIAGEGGAKYVKDLNNRVQKANLSARVCFLGYRRDVFELMASATALIVPSRCEGFGYITVEAMYMGCLVIGNNSGGTKEILEKENLGILYTGHNELVASMLKVVNKGIESYYPTIKKAQNCALSLYSQKKNATAIYNLYLDTLNTKTNPKCKD